MPSDVHLAEMAAERRLRPAVPVPFPAPLGGDERIPGDEGPVLGTEVCQARVASNDNGVHAS